MIWILPYWENKTQVLTWLSLTNTPSEWIWLCRHCLGPARACLWLLREQCRDEPSPLHALGGTQPSAGQSFLSVGSEAILLCSLHSPFELTRAATQYFGRAQLHLHLEADAALDQSWFVWNTVKPGGCKVSFAPMVDFVRWGCIQVLTSFTQRNLLLYCSSHGLMWQPWTVCELQTPKHFSDLIFTNQ